MNSLLYWVLSFGIRSQFILIRFKLHQIVQDRLNIHSTTYSRLDGMKAPDISLVALSSFIVIALASHLEGGPSS